MNIVPVVYGAGPYELYVPKNGFINVLDFETVKDLADQLIKVGNDRDLYNSYFKWKKFMKFEYKKSKSIRAGQFCDICIKMNLNRVEGKNYSQIPFSDVRKYWGKENCNVNSLSFENGTIPKITI